LFFLAIEHEHEHGEDEEEDDEDRAEARGSGEEQGRDMKRKSPGAINARALRLQILKYLLY